MHHFILSFLAYLEVEFFGYPCVCVFWYHHVVSIPVFCINSHEGISIYINMYHSVFWLFEWEWVCVCVCVCVGVCVCVCECVCVVAHMFESMHLFVCVVEGGMCAHLHMFRCI